MDQLEIRKKFLGEAFWVRKMHMFNEARKNIVKEADQSANKAVRARPSFINSSTRHHHKMRVHLLYGYNRVQPDIAVCMYEEIPYFARLLGAPAVRIGAVLPR